MMDLDITEERLGDELFNMKVRSQITLINNLVNAFYVCRNDGLG